MCLGIPGKIIAISHEEHRLGIVEVSGVKREINLACIVDANHNLAECVGDWVLVHVGFAMARINEEEAERTLSLLRELGDAADLGEVS
ncbi:HypC/HybG/HupF family hydrogenase formation chaperone [Zhongshania sp.]|uniref:HypC/HybG/HupF family hydrogenase formation chaperone n=1 Tax=Zhongshania sp. TaxID=1971902 RepID=UPI00356AAB9E